jgi:iron complex outermembrane receptor protein
LDSQIVQDNIIPHLTADEAANLTRVVGRWRALPGGNRTNEFKTDTLNIVAGIDGEYEDVSYDLAVSFAKSERNNTYITGYPIGESFLALLRSGTVNVFDTPENMSDEAKADVKATMYNGPWSTTETTTKAVEGKISMPLFEMGGGEVMFASGFDYRKHSYALSYSQANKDAIILFSRPSDEFDLSRDTYGIFGEFMVPISDQLEVTTSFRRDTIGKITNSLDVGEKVDTKSASDNTFKVNLAYRPNDDWLLRASVGTGFKAPSMRSIAEPRIEFGVTSGNYDCPFPDSDPLASKCHPDPIQYNMYRQGNPNLKPETSEQASAGFVYAPSQNFTFKVDWWQVNIEDQVGAVSESQIFDNPERYRELFTTRIDPGTGDDRLAIISAPVNVGKSNNEGIDWGFILKNDLSFGTLRTKFDSTYMITSEALVIGTEDEYQSSMNQYGQNQAVTFRNIFRLENSLESGDFIHRFNVSWRSGYKDQKHPGDSSILLASDLDTTYKKEVQLTIPSYALFDYSTTYSVNDDAKVTFGIKNLADKKPPLSLRDGGVGHQVGYDPRYTDSFGRTLFVSADYTF